MRIQRQIINNSGLVHSSRPPSLISLAFHLLMNSMPPPPWPWGREDGIISEVEAGEHAISWLVSLPYGNMGRGALVQEPSKQLAGSIGGIGREPLRLQAERCLASIKHGCGGVAGRTVWHGE